MPTRAASGELKGVEGEHAWTNLLCRLVVFCLADNKAENTWFIHRVIVSPVSVSQSYRVTGARTSYFSCLTFFILTCFDLAMM